MGKKHLQLISYGVIGAYQGNMEEKNFFTKAMHRVTNRSQRWQYSINFSSQLLPHPPNHPNLAFGDYKLFTNLKIMLVGKRYDPNKEMIFESETYFAGWVNRCIRYKNVRAALD